MGGLQLEIISCPVFVSFRKFCLEPSVQYFKKDCLLPLTFGNFSDTDMIFRSDANVFIKEAIEIIVKT